MEELLEVVVLIGGLIKGIFSTLMFFAIFLGVMAVSGFDSCTCGMGPKIRESINKTVTQQPMKETKQTTKLKKVYF